MIPEELQDQAALYALGALDPSETAAFEKVLAQDASLRAMVLDLKEAAAALTHSLPAKVPPPELRRQILSEVALEKQAGSAAASRRARAPRLGFRGRSLRCSSFSAEPSRSIARGCAANSPMSALPMLWRR